MKQHVTVLGYLFLANGVFMLLTGLFLSLVLGGSAVASGDPGAAGILAGVGGMLWIALLIYAVPNLLAGWGLLRRLNWARPLALVMGALSLLSFPLGTALGVYALWALTRPEVMPEFA